MLSLHIYLQSSLSTFEQMLHSMQKSITKPDHHLEFLQILLKAQLHFVQVNSYTRTHLATITRRIPSVLLISIFQFLCGSERKRILLVCKVWSETCQLPIPRIIKSPRRFTTSVCAIPHESDGKRKSFCLTCVQVVCPQCNFEEHKTHSYVPSDEAPIAAKSVLKSTLNIIQKRLGESLIEIVDCVDKIEKSSERITKNEK